MREARSATVERLTARVAVSTLAGIGFGLAIAAAVNLVWGPPTASLLGSPLADLAMVAIGSVIVGAPFFAIAVLLLLYFRRSVFAHPVIWCVCIPALLLAAGLFVFPPWQIGGIFWIVLIPLCALGSGLAFLGWLKARPLYAVDFSAS